MWLYVACLIGLYYLFRWYRERQVASNLRDKYVFITGCDSGFGNLLAKQLDLQGLRGLAACLREKGAEQLRRETSDRVETVILDVTKTESITAAAQWVKERVGNKGLWGLINNAGAIFPDVCTELMTKVNLMKTMNTNLFGVIEVTMSMLQMVKQARGRIVNVSSFMGRLAFFSVAYCCSKYGVEAFSDCLRTDMQPFGVKVCVVEPGGFKTNLTNVQKLQECLENSWNKGPVEVKESYGQEFFEKFLIINKNSLQKCSTNLHLVTDCMEHALTSRYPRYRYSAGWDAQFFFIPLSYLPTVLSDYVWSANCLKPAHAV
ncbi:17-beta-hydroxysteroid dehydrogenase type 6-like [Trichosurus vulpecula]|uniref:17-beta-hydroxysteroid dehydrogenase type 6-like n=1 Tax=Trichosurus vulpecula TaxID=9337 RepID=UPI00186AD4E9|nr:17-beta-hydroxysteroid dehydrogenase type 6-like [Trichosurus vulpecula]XP_036615499.1 17-beta-hydroxysteroid dehydrogenase type 6-like [Trichosurus vulpecula]